MATSSENNLVLSESLFWLAFLLPLFSFIVSIIISERYAWLVTLSAPLCLLGACIASSILLVGQWNEPPTLIDIRWFSVGQHTFSANLLLSNQSVLMLFVVSLISFLVHLYSTGYMAGDRNIRRYFAMLGFFTFAMQGIVLADSLLLIFVFWELVGFSSYFLIGHYTESPDAARAAKKAFIMNRIGDAGFLIGLMIIWIHTESFNLSEIFLAEGSSLTWHTTASLFIFAGVIGKSAQFPLFPWLPDAMEGPTPVSALIHAATMVAAGVYLLTRLSPLFTTTSLVVVASVGAITSVIGALAALSQYDIKKILAYSTVSQLGLMVMAIGAGLYEAALLHLFTHAFFKACLFLCAGSVIHSLHQSHAAFDVQDIRNMGGLRTKLPVTFIAFLISGASLAGVPFFSGFLSKEAILTAVWTHSNMVSWMILFTMTAVSFITVLYTFRAIWFVFFGEERTTKQLTIMEVPVVMRAPVILLAACSLWFIVSWNPLDFTGWIVPAAKNPTSVGITFFSIIWVLLALIVGWFFFRGNEPKSYPLFRNAFYMNELYLFTFRKSIPPLAKTSALIDDKIIDRSIHLGAYSQVTLAHIVGWLDKIFVDGVVHGFVFLASAVGKLGRNFQSGKIQLYIFWATFAIIIFLICTLN